MKLVQWLTKNNSKIKIILMNGFPYYVTTLTQLHFTDIFWISLRYMQSLKPGFPSKTVPDTFFHATPVGTIFTRTWKILKLRV